MVIHKTEYYSAIKREWRTNSYNSRDGSKNHLLNERSQTQKAIHCIILFIWHSKKGKTTRTENEFVVARDQRWEEGGVKGEAWEKCSSNGTILYSTVVVET